MPRAVVERGLARMGTRCPGKRVGARVMVVRRVLIRLGVREEAAPPAEGVAGDAVEVVVVVVSMAFGKELGLERKKGSWPIPLESTRSVGTYSLTEPTTIHLSSMRLSPRPMKPMNRGTTHSHVCCRFHTMQSLQRNSRGGSAAPSPPPSGPPPAAAAAAAVPSSAEAAAAEAAPGGEAAAAPSLILGAGLHLRPPEGRARGMGPRGPGAGAGSGGGGLGCRQRPRRPHANRLPAPTPLPPRGGRRAGRRERGRGRGRGGGGEERARGARRAPGAAGRSGSGGARLQPAKRPPARRGPAPAATARRLLALQPRRHPRGAAPGRSPGRPPAPLLGLAPPSGAEPAGCGMQDAGEPHSDTGGPAWLPPLARPGAPRSSAAAPLVQAARCTCSSAGPQPTLGQHSPGETNPSAARRASGRARLDPAACGSALPPPPESQTPASCAAAASPGPGAHGAPAAGAVGSAGEGTRRELGITLRRRSPVALGEVKRETASGIPGYADPGPEASPGGFYGCRAGAVCAEPRRTGWASVKVAPPTNT